MWRKLDDVLGVCIEELFQLEEDQSSSLRQRLDHDTTNEKKYTKIFKKKLI